MNKNNITALIKKMLILVMALSGKRKKKSVRHKSLIFLLSRQLTLSFRYIPVLTDR